MSMYNASISSDIPGGFLTGFPSVIHLLALIPIVVAIYHSQRAKPLPNGVKWVGRRGELFADTRACIRGLTNGIQNIKDGYHQFNKAGKPFIIPDPSLQPEVIIPPESIKWLLQQPDNVVSQRSMILEKQALGYLLPEFDYHTYIPVVRRDLTQSVGKTQPDLFDELRNSVDQLFGVDGSWHSVSIFHSMEDILLKSINRILVGLPLCRDQRYISSWRKFSSYLGVAGVILGQIIPWSLRPIVGVLFKIPIQFYRIKSLNCLLPTVNKRLAKMLEYNKDPSIACDVPDDFLTWCIRTSIKATDDPINSPPDAATIAKDFHIFCISFFHTTTLTATNTMLDLVSAAPELGYVEALREEAAAVFKTETDWYDAALVPKLHCMDSTLREALRLNPISTRGSNRRIVSKSGLTLPSGVHLPYGTWVANSLPGIHRDERFYPNPTEYQPFRFTPTQQADSHEVKETTETKATDEPASDKKATALATTSETFLAFGYGRHACAGRWFAAHVLKLMFAYIIVNYDIEHIEKRPPYIDFGNVSVPPSEFEMRVRRRQE